MSVALVPVDPAGLVRYRPAPPAPPPADAPPAALGALVWRPAVRQRKAVVGVALGIPLRRIARGLGCSHTQIARLERQGIAAIAAIPNIS